MLIQVNYKGDSYDYIKDFMLDTMIASGVIEKFRRSSGWVRIGVDPVRSERQATLYGGAERRTARA